MSNILDASAIISLIPSLFSSSDKTLKSPQDALAVLSHTILSALAFRLIAVDDSSASSHLPTNALPVEWNSHGPGSYTFRYKHDQSSLEYVIKVSKLGSRTLINAIAVENDKTTSLDISTNDFTSPSSFPYDAGAAQTPLVHCFISSNRVADFISQFKLKIVQKLVPGLRKDGYTEEVDVDSSSSTSTRSMNSANNNNTQQHVSPPPRIPRYNPDDDGFPLRMGGAGWASPRNPLEIGRRDLDPIPGGSFGNPSFQPPPLFPSSSGGDGMFVGPNHPIFGGRGSGSQGMGIPGNGNRGPWGGDGYLPPMGAPPGARFDPVGPGFGIPGGPGGGGIGPFPGGGGMGGFGGFGGPRRPNLPGGTGDPDNDEFMPPGAENMYM